MDPLGDWQTPWLLVAVHQSQRSSRLLLNAQDWVLMQRLLWWRMFETQSPARLGTSMSFQLCRLYQPLLLIEAQMENWTLHHLSHHFAARLHNQSVAMCDASRCKCGSWTWMDSQPQIAAPDNSCTVWASSPLPSSHARPTACSDHTERFSVPTTFFHLTTRWVLNSWGVSFLLHLLGCRLGGRNLRLITTGFQCTTSSVHECS